MSTHNRRLELGFILAGITNFCIILFSRGYSNSLGLVDAHFDTGGCLLITLWGAAYLSIARNYSAVRWLCVVFGIEKLFYVSRWVLFLSSSPNFDAIWNNDPLAAIFFGIYGLVDAAYGLFFFYAGFTSLKSRGN